MNQLSAQTADLPFRPMRRSIRFIRSGAPAAGIDDRTQRVYKRTARRCPRRWASTLLGWLLMFNSHALYASTEVLSVGIFPRRAPAVTRTLFTPLVEYLGRTLGRPITLDSAPDFTAFWQRLRAGRYDLVHLNQYHYLKAHAEAGYRVVASNQERGKDTLRAALWVRTDSGIYNIHDLRGRVIVFGGGRSAMISHIAARDLLRRAGIADTTYLSRYTLHPVGAIQSVYYRQSDAAGMGEDVAHLPLGNHPIELEQMRVLARSEPLAHLPWAVAPSLSPQTSARIGAALMALNDTEEGRSILSQAGLTGINAASDNHYDIHRAIVERVLGEQY